MLLISSLNQSASLLRVRIIAQCFFIYWFIFIEMVKRCSFCPALILKCNISDFCGSPSFNMASFSWLKSSYSQLYLEQHCFTVSEKNICHSKEAHAFVSAGWCYYIKHSLNIKGQTLPLFAWLMYTMMAVILPKTGHVICSNDTQNIFLSFFFLVAFFFKWLHFAPIKRKHAERRRHETTCLKAKYLINRSAFIVAVVK